MLYRHLEDLEKIARNAREEYEERTKPESIYRILADIVEGYSDKCNHSDERGMLRNKAIDIICAQLNRLQEDAAFQTPYNVKCELKKRT